MIWLLVLLFPPISTQLDLSAIKRFQTTLSGGVTVTVPTTTAGPCNVGCQNGWVPYGANCYKKVDGTLTQSSAEQQCVNLGAHLASFSSEIEASAVKLLVLDASLFTDDLMASYSSSQTSWIGLMKSSSGSWTWTDSSTVTYKNLENDSVSGAACVYMNQTGDWKATSCSSTSLSSICKRASSPTS